MQDRYKKRAGLVGHQYSPPSCSAGEGGATRHQSPKYGSWHHGCAWRHTLNAPRLACGNDGFASCVMHGVAPLLCIGPSPARDPPMAHGQHHKPRQPMRRRQPHRGSCGQPSGTVTTTRGRSCSCMQSSSNPQTCSRRVYN